MQFLVLSLYCFMWKVCLFVCYLGTCVRSMAMDGMMKLQAWIFCRKYKKQEGKYPASFRLKKLCIVFNLYIFYFTAKYASCPVKQWHCRGNIRGNGVNSGDLCPLVWTW